MDAEGYPEERTAVTGIKFFNISAYHRRAAPSLERMSPALSIQPAFPVFPCSDNNTFYRPEMLHFFNKHRKNGDGISAVPASCYFYIPEVSQISAPSPSIEAAASTISAILSAASLLIVILRFTFAS